MNKVHQYSRVDSGDEDPPLSEQQEQEEQMKFAQLERKRKRWERKLERKRWERRLGLGFSCLLIVTAGVQVVGSYRDDPASGSDPNYWLISYSWIQLGVLIVAALVVMLYMYDTSELVWVSGVLRIIAAICQVVGMHVEKNSLSMPAGILFCVSGVLQVLGAIALFGLVKCNLEPQNNANMIACVSDLIAAVLQLAGGAVIWHARANDKTLDNGWWILFLASSISQLVGALVFFVLCCRDKSTKNDFERVPQKDPDDNNIPMQLIQNPNNGQMPQFSGTEHHHRRSSQNHVVKKV